MGGIATEPVPDETRVLPVPLVGQWKKWGVRTEAVTLAQAYKLLDEQTGFFRSDDVPAVRHYRSGGMLHTGFAPLAAWLHVIEALPWKVDVQSWSAAVTAAYAPYVGRGWASLSVGAQALERLNACRVVKLLTAAEIVEWLALGAGPVALAGVFRQGLLDVDPVTEIAEAQSSKPLGGHAVALVGVKLRGQMVRLVNNQGPAWGALGRAWWYSSALSGLLKGTSIGQRCGEAWGVVPRELVSKNAKGRA